VNALSDLKGGFSYVETKSDKKHQKREENKNNKKSDRR